MTRSDDHIPNLPRRGNFVDGLRVYQRQQSTKECSLEGGFYCIFGSLNPQNDCASNLSDVQVKWALIFRQGRQEVTLHFRVGSSRILDTKTDIAWSYFIHKIMRIWFLNSMNNTEGRNCSLERQRSRTTLTQESAVATVKCGFLWKTSFHTGRTSSKSRYFVLTRSSLDHFRNNQTVVINFFSVSVFVFGSYCKMYSWIVMYQSELIPKLPMRTPPPPR